jgi:hypothetical protein
MLRRFIIIIPSQILFRWINHKELTQKTRSSHWVYKNFMQCVDLADELSREGSAHHFVGPEPAVGGLKAVHKE